MKTERELPELLLPTGNIEAFNAAIEGGCDAIYLGLKSFNARSRARNFTAEQLSLMCDIAHEKNIKVYVTLNVVIKNSELVELSDTLYQISQTSADAIIIQDWGVYNIVKREFPTLNIHASTQMANHNSTGSSYSKQCGFERVVMARELTLPELTTISDKKETELELFIHGALCYSFSGLCSFSSFLGGAGANRGACTQPCRRLFSDGADEKHLFSLKDNEQIDNIPKLIELGVDSLKIEGRMKSADYVYQVARAYRVALDNPDSINEAKKMLRYDMGREKTSYFLGGEVKHAITETPNTGVYLGSIVRVEQGVISLSTQESLKDGDRVRVVSNRGERQENDKIKDLVVNGRLVSYNTSVDGVKKGDKVYLAGVRIKRFKTKLDTAKLDRLKIKRELSDERLKRAGSFKLPMPPKEDEIYIRVDNIEWLKNIHFDYLDGLIISLTKTGWSTFQEESSLTLKNSDKVWIELPKFISEKSISYYRELTQQLYNQGYKQFMLSHLSQKLIIPKGAKFATNETVYTYNDAAVNEVISSGAVMHTYPLENDYDNLIDGSDRSGIIPLYFKPTLFHSRMPVDIEDNSIKDDTKNRYNSIVRDGVTNIVSDIPVSLTQYRKKLHSDGFRRFLIDLSYENISKNLIKKIQKRMKNSEPIQPSSNFNFKKGLK